LGFGLWLWSWFLGRTPVKQMRLRDCGVVMVFSGILVRVITQDRAFGVFDWVMLLLGPLFIAAALWRLARTGA
jgi:hypothetical protein